MAISMTADRAEHFWLRRVHAGASAFRRALIGVTAGTAIACWLAVLPAMAQQPDGDALSRKGAGENATAPSLDLSDRKQLLIVGSSTMDAIIDAVIERLNRDYVIPQPMKRLAGTQQGIKDFCAGVGADFPDIIAASHRVSRSEFDTCIENGVLDVIEVLIGQSALVVATKKGNPTFNVTPRMVYYAVAEDILIKGEFTANPYKSWKETNSDAPDLPIHVVIPAQGSGTRSFFDDNFMQGGCRHVKEIDAIFAAADRVPRCIQRRDDGLVTEVAEPFEDEAIQALAKAPPGTVAIIPWGLYLSIRDKLDVLPVSGVLPTHEGIAEFSYAMATNLHYYFKRAHMRNNAGRGVVRGIREFMAETVSDEAAAEGGYFEGLGVIALGPDERQKQKTIVRRLKRFEP
jgi:phosphate transport system substrate-binding protein